MSAAITSPPRSTPDPSQKGASRSGYDHARTPLVSCRVTRPHLMPADPHGGAYADQAARAEATDVVLTDPASGTVVLALPVGNAWDLTHRMRDAAAGAAQRRRTDAEEAPFAGTCPVWCETRHYPELRFAYMDFHHAPDLGPELALSRHIDPASGDPLTLDFEVRQHVLDEDGGQPVAAMYLDALDEPLLMTDEELDQLAAKATAMADRIRGFNAARTYGG